MEPEITPTVFVQEKLDFGTLSPIQILGLGDKHLRKIQDAFPDVRINVRGSIIKIEGLPDNVQRCNAIFVRLIERVQKNHSVIEKDIDTLINIENAQKFGSVEDWNPDDDAFIVRTNSGQNVRAKTPGQTEIVKAVSKNDIVFAIGPAGTGKTYTSVALAVKALKERRVKKIVLVRPAVEAGESLGFLPGGLKEKIDPYLRPLYDALEEMIDLDRLRDQMERHVIEIAPLAYMRGRTLNNAFVILDEAQNATKSQMKMFLTRLGVESKAIITGDVTQTDLPKTKMSGLISVQRVLANIDGIAFVELGRQDVVRHKLIRDIIKAYESADDDNERFQEEE